MRELEGIAVEFSLWTLAFISSGGLSIIITFPYDDGLLMLHYLEEARKARNWILPGKYKPRMARLPRQPAIRATKMCGVYLGSDDEYASVQFESDDEIIDLTLPKEQVVRILTISNSIIASRGWGTYTDRCFHYQGRERCRALKGFRGNFCEEHAETLGKLSDRELIEHAADQMRFFVKQKSSGPALESREPAQVNAVARFATAISELGSRGYTQDDVIKTVGSMAQGKRIIEPLNKNSSDPKWKQFEKLAFGVNLLREDGAKVTYDETITGLRTGRPRQVDICVRYSKAAQQYFVMIECKDEKVPISYIESFCTKKEDVGADHVVVVSSRGFQVGAHAAAEAYGVDIFTLTEISVDWTEKIRSHVHELPWPESIEFDMPPAVVTGISEPVFVPLVATPFVNDMDGTSTNLGLIVRDVCLWAHESGLELPCEVNVRFDGGMSFQPPRSSVFMPVYGLKLVLNSYRVEHRHRIEFSPHTVEYRYSDGKTGETESYEHEDVNRALRGRREDLI